MTGRPRIPLEKRFWPKVLRQDGDQCWLWQGAINKRGYGTISEDGTGRTLLAHRVAYRLTYGEFDQNVCVLHHCDNPKCVRPGHLFLGDYSDNARDAFAKGRRHAPPPRRGEENHNSKLTTPEVVNIKCLLRVGVSLDTIAKAFGVHRATIIEIREGRNWKHITIKWPKTA